MRSSIQAAQISEKNKKKIFFLNERTEISLGICVYSWRWSLLVASESCHYLCMTSNVTYFSQLTQRKVPYLSLSVSVQWLLDQRQLCLFLRKTQVQIFTVETYISFRWIMPHSPSRGDPFLPSCIRTSPVLRNPMVKTMIQPSNQINGIRKEGNSRLNLHYNQTK